MIVAALMRLENTFSNSSMPVPLRIASLFLVLISSCLSQTPSADRIPVQAELAKAIEAGRVHIGDAVYARTDLAWNNAVCKAEASCRAHHTGRSQIEEKCQMISRSSWPAVP